MMKKIRFSLFDMCILAVICFVMTLTDINKDLAEQVEYYKTMYHEKDVAVRLLQERYGVK